MSNDASVAALVNSALADSQSLVKQQIELAKSEIAHSAKRAASTSGLMIGAGVLALHAFLFLLFASAFGLVAAGLPAWAGFLIVAGVLSVGTGVLISVGVSQAKQIGPPKRAISAAHETRSALASRATTNSANLVPSPRS
jgi:hypothetical protein